MLMLAKITHITLGFFAVGAILYAVSAAIGNDPIIYLITSIIIFALLVAAIFTVKKYIVKNSTAIEVKNYGLRIRQVILTVFALMQLTGVYMGTFEKRVVHAVILALILSIIVVTQKRILKNKAEVVEPHL